MLGLGSALFVRVLDHNLFHGDDEDIVHVTKEHSGHSLLATGHMRSARQAAFSASGFVIRRLLGLLARFCFIRTFVLYLCASHSLHASMLMQRP